MDQGKTNVKIEREFRQEWCLSPISFNFYSKCLTMEACEGFGDFDIGGSVIRTMKYSGDLVLLAEGEAILQGVIASLIENGI
jgi:hypothetical protein